MKLPGGGYQPDPNPNSSKPIEGPKSGSGVTQKLGRFDHHPEAASDFCVEVDAIEGMEADVNAGLSSRIQLIARIDDAMMFRVGGDPLAVQAKNQLRKIEARVKPSIRSNFRVDGERVQVCPGDHEKTHDCDWSTLSPEEIIETIIKLTTSVARLTHENKELKGSLEVAEANYDKAFEGRKENRRRLTAAGKEWV